MKKIGLCLVLVLTLLTSLCLVGCGQNAISDEYLTIEEIIAHAKTLSYGESGGSSSDVTGTPNFNVPEGGYDGSEVTIKFYHTMGQNLRSVLVKYIEKFNQIYPNITIEEEQVGGYDDVRSQIATELTVGSEPNMAYCYPDHVALYNNTGKVVTLDNLIASQVSDGNGGIIGLTNEQLSDFIEGYYNEGKQFGDGLMYTLPFSKSTEVLYYNKTFFEEHNLSVPNHWFSEGENDATSLEYVCEKIKEIEPSCIPLGYDSEANWFITMAEQCGADYTSATGDHYLFNNATMRTVLERFRDWYQKGYITTQTLFGAYTSGLFVNVKEGETHSYMSIGSSAGATHQRPEAVTKLDDAGKEVTEYPFEVGIASIPQMSQTYKRVISQGPSICIFNKANPQEVVATWLFAKYLVTSTQFQAEFSAASGYVPVLKSVSEVSTYKKNLDNADGGKNIAFLSAKVCLEQVEAYYTSPAFVGSSVARDQVGSLLSTVLAKEAANARAMISQAFADAIAECEYQG